MMKWVAAAILAGAGIWGGVTWAIILRETEWRWIPVAIAVEAVIVAGAIVTPKLRPKMLLGAGLAVFVTAIAVAFLLPRTWCSGYSWTGGTPYDCHGFPLWGRILVAGIGLMVALILTSFARDKPDRGHRAVGFSEGPETARDQFPAGSPEREGASATEDASAPFASHRRLSSSRSMPTSTARSVRSSSQSIRSSAKARLCG
jgi:hypothetical protein